MRQSKRSSFQEAKLFRGEFRPKADRPGVINDLHGDNFFLDNFYPCNVVFEGIEYPSTEHAYQAAKSLDPKARKVIARCPSPGVAKAQGNRLAIRQGWDEMKYEVMRRVLIRKFAQPRFLRGLVATGKLHIIEGNTWNDTYWGVCKGVGENKLGELLMELRSQHANNPRIVDAWMAVSFNDGDE